MSSVVEKPSPENAPSDYAIMGRYVLEPEIFEILETLSPGAGNEIQLTDAIKLLNETKNVLAYEFKGKRYDVGDKLGFIKATIDLSLEREDISTALKSYLNELAEKKELVHF